MSLSMIIRTFGYTLLLLSIVPAFALSHSPVKALRDMAPQAVLSMGDGVAASGSKNPVLQNLRAPASAAGLDPRKHHLRAVSIVGNVVPNGNFHGLMAGSQIRYAVMPGARFSGDFANSVVEKSMLVNARFKGNLSNTTFDAVTAPKAEFLENLSGARFKKSVLPSATFRGNLSDAIFESSSLPASSFKGDLSGVTFKSSVLPSAKFSGVTTTKAPIIFEDSALQGADLRGNFQREYRRAKYNQDTMFPDGFDPRSDPNLIWSPGSRR